MAIPDYNANKILVEALRLSPEAAIKFFRDKGFVITWDWREQLLLNNAEVFTVAKVQTMDLLEDIKAAVDQAISEGLSYKSFQKVIEPKLFAKGWIGRKTVLGPRGLETVQLGSVGRLKTIFRTNTQSAYNAGRFKGQIENKSDRPILELIEADDAVTRTTHRQASGSRQHINHKFWKSPNSWYAPNGFNCRGRVRALTLAQAEARGGLVIKTTRNPDPGFGNSPISPFKLDKTLYSKKTLKLGNQLKPRSKNA